MLTYKNAEQMFQKARNKDRGLVLPGRLGQTRLVKTDTGYGVKYMNTVVVHIEPGDVYTLNSDGFRTRTTKDRMNEYGPVNVHQSKNVWYIGDVVYSDGIKLNKRGKVIQNKNKQQAKVLDKLHKQVEQYATQYVAAIQAKQLPEPSGGDCWGCCMVDVKTGKTVMGTDHLTQHLEEGYFVPSLLVNALKAKGYNPAYINPWNGISTDPSTFKRAIKSYMLNSLSRVK